MAFGSKSRITVRNVASVTTVGVRSTLDQGQLATGCWRLARIRLGTGSVGIQLVQRSTSFAIFARPAFTKLPIVLLARCQWPVASCLLPIVRFYLSLIKKAHQHK